MLSILHFPFTMECNQSNDKHGAAEERLERGQRMVQAGVPMRTLTISNTLECLKCDKKNTVSYVQIQTRSAEEPRTTSCECVNCGHRWKVNAYPSMYGFVSQLTRCRVVSVTSRSTRSEHRPHLDRAKRLGCIRKDFRASYGLESPEMTASIRCTRGSIDPFKPYAALVNFVPWCRELKSQPRGLSVNANLKLPRVPVRNYKKFFNRKKCTSQ